jgi:hypothetical protein
VASFDIVILIVSASFAVVAAVDWLLSRHESLFVCSESKDTAIEGLILPLACGIELRLLGAMCAAICANVGRFCPQ